MFTAYVSGTLGRGIWREQETFFLLETGAPIREATWREVIQTTSAESDYELCTVDSIAALSETVKSVTNVENTIFLLLSTINPSLEIHTRLMCAQAIEPLLDGDIRDRLLSRLLSKSLPGETRITSSKAQEYFQSFNKLSALMREIFESQDAIAMIDGAFIRATKEMTENEAANLRAEFVHFRAYPPIVRAIRALNADAFNNAIISTLLKLKDSTLQTASENVLHAVRHQLIPLFKKQPTQQQDLAFNVPMKPKRFATRDKKSIDELLSEDPLLTLSRISSFEAKTIVDKHLAGIKKQILNGRPDLVDKYLADLVRFQVENSEKVHLAKSLSLLTSVALASNQLAIADKLSLYAIRAEENDAVVFTSRAEVLKYQGLFDASLQAYRDAKLRFPESSYAWNGEADVLKEAGRYEEAIAAYKTVRARFADDPVPHNGLVSTLRRMGRLIDATNEARKNVKTFQDNTAIRTELGHVLSARGRYHEAVVQYRKVLDQDPKQVHALFAYVRALNFMGDRTKALALLQRQFKTENGPVIWNAIATQLRVMGQLEKALKESKALVAAYPGYTPGRYTLATVLLLVGESAMAISELPKSEIHSEGDWIGYRIYLTCMLTGNREDAVKKLESARDNCVWQNQKSRIATVLGVAYSRARKPKEALEIFEAAASLPDEHHKQVRLALLGALNAELGRKKISETILTRILITRDPTIIKFKTSVLTHHAKQNEVLPLLLAA